jgi:diguanylate cyclase (GGDEF)-like protein/PAS domain S-box-containing protein
MAGQGNEHIDAEEQRTPSAIRRSETNLRRILEAAPYPIVVRSRDRGALLYINRLACELFGIDAKAARYGTSQEFFVDPHDREQVLDVLEKLGKVEDYECMLRGAGTRVFPALVCASHVSYEGEPSIVLTFNDVTNRKEMETELVRLATTDGLTGVANRRSFMDLGEREVRRSKRYQSALSVLMLDLDYFKQVNDKHGHAAGDEVLKYVARAVIMTLRETDIVGRLGGEEFAALLPETNGARAMEVAQRLRDKIAASEIEVGEAAIKVTVSIGVTERREMDDIASMLKRADDAMYKAKTGGRNQVTGAIAE